MFLEAPRHLGNLGAAIRVAAAADAAAVLTSGHNDPWHPDAIRGSAGLHFALPVGHVDEPPERGIARSSPSIPTARSARHRGTRSSRSGASVTGSATRCWQRADARIRIPMRAGVSSLNLATSVAAVLYGFTARA